MANQTEKAKALQAILGKLEDLEDADRRDVIRSVVAFYGLDLEVGG